MTNRETVEEFIEDCRLEWLFDNQNNWSLSFEVTRTYKIDGEWERIWSPEFGAYIWRKKF